MGRVLGVVRDEDAEGDGDRREEIHHAWEEDETGLGIPDYKELLSVPGTLVYYSTWG